MNDWERLTPDERAREYSARADIGERLKKEKVIRNRKRVVGVLLCWNLTAFFLFVMMVGEAEPFSYWESLMVVGVIGLIVLVFFGLVGLIAWLFSD